MLLGKMKLKGELMRCFKNGEIVKVTTYGTKTYERYPKIHEVHVDEEREAVRFTFTLPNGLNPKSVLDQEWVFKQSFGSHIELSGNKYKKFILWVYSKGMPDKVKYDYDQIKPHMDDKLVPIVVGYDRRNMLNVLDLKDLHHILLTGTTGSGKSSLFRSMLVSLMLHTPPQEIQFILADFKKSEFGIYRNLPWVKSLHMEQDEFLTELKKVEREMKRRGALLDKYDLDHVSELKEKLPVIMIVVDELYEVVDNDKIKKILTKIACLGRSSQIHIIGALQRGDAKSLGGQFLNNMNCRISGKQADSTNAKVAGMKTTKDISVAGRMVLSINGEEKQVQVPFMDKQQAKKMLAPYKLKVVEPEVVEVVEELVDSQLVDSHVIDENDDIATLPTFGGFGQ